ncbi:MAG: hypothetical protein B7Z16_16245, partial [Algoriphagus sp. 32-45-6]
RGRLYFLDQVDSLIDNLETSQQFVPVQKVDEKISRLEGFAWRIDEKPDKATIDAWRTVLEIDLGARNLFNEPELEIILPTEEEIQQEVEKKSVKPLKKPLLKTLKTDG